MKSKDFDFWKLVYDEEVWDVEMLKEAVKYKGITPEEYKEITGEEFSV